jgi:hypothetical protein
VQRSIQSPESAREGENDGNQNGVISHLKFSSAIAANFFALATAISKKLNQRSILIVFETP